MASTVQQFNTNASALSATVNAVDDDLTGINAELKSITADPTQANATSTLNSLTTQLGSLKSETTSTLNSQFQTLSSTYVGLPPDERNTLTAAYGVFDQKVANTNNQIKNTEAALASAREAVNKTVQGNGAQQNTSGTVRDDDATGNTTTTGADQVAVGISPKPRKNPLGDYASYTYQITLYMITPDAYNAFVNSGRRNINALRTTVDENGNVGTNTNIQGGAFIIAQSGGSATDQKFNPYFSLDYYIDKLTIKSHIAGESEVNYSEISFNIIEPYGFSFLTNLRGATEQIGLLSKNTKKYVNPSRQFYVLGIRFYGYDENGNLVDRNTVNTTGENNNQLYERFFDITISELKFKLDGKATVYAIKAVGTCVSGALTTKRGVLKQAAPIQASTVGEAIDQLVKKMTYDEGKNTTKGPKNTYKVEFIGNEEAVKALRNAPLAIPSDISKSTWATSNATNTLEVNEIESITASPNSNIKSITFRAGTSVADAINGIIKRSMYLVEALNSINASQQFGKNGRPVVENTPTKELSWYNLSVEVANADYNAETLNDWVYDITYVIQPYAAPAIYSPFVSRTLQYYGPHKRYEYYFTGQNSEIISYEQNYDSTYFTVALEGKELPFDPTQDAGGALNSYAPVVSGKRTDNSRIGQIDTGFETQNQVLTSLYDVGALTSAKLTILGDPDFLVSENSSSLSQVYNMFYGADGYTINPNGGQVFIEVDFKEAVDYDMQKGVLRVNENILFFNYPASIKNSIKGVVFQVYDLTSSFDNGKFIQQLSLTLPPFTESNTSIEIDKPRQDTEKEAAETQCTVENTRTLTTDANSNDPATKGGTKVPGSEYLTFEDKNPQVTKMVTTFASDLPTYSNNLSAATLLPKTTTEDD